MAIMVRRAAERGHGDHGWLDTWHTFSFADYHDPRFMGFRVLRVINEDTVAPGGGFPTHGHRDMEIISYVLEGGLQHRDSLGTGSVIRPGDVNASTTEPVHFLQIWIEPASRGIAPGYEQKTFADADKRGRLRLVASPDGAEGSVTIHQDARVYATSLAAGEEVEHKLAPGRHAWVQVTRGALLVAGQQLEHGDGAAITGEPAVTLAGERDAEAIVFDLP
jgi:quercetin 2,3-dioxygenase